MRNHEIRLIVCDLDGTLLNRDKRITPRTEQVLKKAKELGISLCFASGRDAQMMSVYDRQVGGCDYLLSNNGAIVHTRSGEILHSSFLTEQDAAQILAFLNQQEMCFMMYSAREMYFSQASEKLQDRIRKYEALSRDIGCPVTLNVRELTRNAELSGFRTAAKIVAYEDDPASLDHFEAFLDTLPGVHKESTGYGLMGAFQKDVSKQTALEKIMQDMHITRDNVCVFGDFDNDLSMFACAKYRICMENGVQALKNAATFVTASNNEDGVAQYLESVLDIRP